MTRGEAIQELQNCKGLILQDGQDYLDDRDIPLLDMAIEALSAEPPYQYSEAYVEQIRGERDILQDMVNNMAEPKLMEDGTLEVHVHDARLVGRVLIGDKKNWGGLYYPDAEPKTGRWKEVYSETDYRNGWIEFSCECCEHQHGLESGEYGWSYGEPVPWKFCPLCGAKMEGGEEE